ncbi:ABA4-like family protein [Aquimarina sp. W85]|uniref:ABA4-like family protein n=1 Tax=Aquimarina rhodophyticola TaxID=3342246 RepID=UPI00366A5977
MTPSEVFSLVGMITIMMWILMIFLPKWKLTRVLVDFKIIPLILSTIYLLYIFQAIQIGGMMDFGSLSSVMELFTEENAVLAGWIHYLAFDLLIGIWILNQNKKFRISSLLIAPCLLATFMFGPMGFLLFMIIKIIKKPKHEISKTTS